MTELPSKSLTSVARLAVLLIVVLGVVGAVWYGFSAEVRQRIWQDLLDRPGGPMTFRIILQPIMAAVAALLDGIKDAKGGRNPYLWTMITNAAERGGRLREGLIATARIILLGLGIDAIYQFSVFHEFYPGEAVIVAIILAFVPYLLLRGPFSRIARRWFVNPHQEQSR
jgi:hypothetical protein